jgi:hypothetical protein
MQTYLSNSYAVAYLTGQPMSGTQGGSVSGVWDNKQAVIWQHSYRLHTEWRWFSSIFGILSVCVNSTFGISDVRLGAGISQSVQRLATCWTTGEFGFWVSVGSRKIFLLSTSPRPVLWFTQCPSNGHWGLFPAGVKWPEFETDHSSPTSGQFKEIWIYAATLPYALMA